MKEITKNQATAIWQIFFVLWLTLGSIVCFKKANTHAAYSAGIFETAGSDRMG